MALSSWDTLAANEKGESIEGVFVSPKCGVVVEFYKNWIYVRDEHAWQEESNFVKPTVMQIKLGNITYKDVQILAIRGPQDGIYAAVWTKQYQEQVEGTPYKEPIITGMIGCGVYGFDGGDFVGVTPESRDWFAAKLRETVEEVVEIKQLGIKDTYKHPVLDVPDVLKSALTESVRRFNQGDAYFAARLDSKIPSTEPGKAEPTTMSKIIEAMKT